MVLDLGALSVAHVINVTRKIGAVNTFPKLIYYGLMEAQKHGRGRPAVEDARDNLRSIRMSDAELEAVEQAAEAAGVSVAAFIRDAAVRAAKRKPRAAT